MEPDLKNNEFAAGGDSPVVRVDNELVKLPESAGVDTTSDEFCQMAVAVLPEDIRLEVQEQLQNRKERYSRFEIFVCILIIAVIGVTAYKFFTPQVQFSDTVEHDIPIAAQKLDAASPEGRLLGEMNRHSVAGNYDKCIKSLSKRKLASIIADPEKLGKNSEAVNIYLTALHLINSPENKAAYIEEGRQISRQLVNTAPDVPAWHLHRMGFENYAVIAQNAFRNIPVSRKNGVELARLEQELARLEKIEPVGWNGKELRLFDLWRCKIYIACWLRYLAYDNTHYLHDNNNGVREREKAYEIAEKYSGKDRKFLDLQKFILQKMLKELGLIQPYTFKGEKLYFEATLEQELKIVTGMLAKAKKAAENKD